MQSEDDLEGTIDEDDNLIETQDNNSRPSTGTGSVTLRKTLAGKIMSNRSASVESESYNLAVASSGGKQASDPSNLSMMDTIHGGSGHSINPWELTDIIIT